jgi:ribosomal protein S18 acetylase RimI-like enzyme
MTMATGMQSTDYTVRRLIREDLAKVTEIDASHSGTSRRGYFEKRLAAALREPNSNIQLGIDGAAGLEAYVLARILDGEFGQVSASVLLEVIGVAPGSQRSGMGMRLIAALEMEMRARGIARLQTQAEWSNHGLLKYFADNGFSKAPRHIIQRSVEGFDALETSAAEEAELVGDALVEPSRDRFEIASMGRGEYDDLVRIDRKITGRDRRRYMRRKFDEAMLDTGIRVSLTARCDGIVAGFVMARIDLGDFGRSVPVAVIDTIDVAPDFGRRGIAEALLSQLLVNLGALHVDAVETTVAVTNMDLMAFFYRCGFTPSERIAFEKQVI